MHDIDEVTALVFQASLVEIFAFSNPVGIQIRMIEPC